MLTMTEDYVESESLVLQSSTVGTFEIDKDTETRLCFDLPE